MRYKFITLFLVFFFNIINAQVVEENVDLMSLVNDLLMTKKNGDNIKQSWLIPSEYWQVALSDSKYANAEMAAEIEKVFSDYVLVAATNINISPLGSFTRSEGDVELMDSGGKIYKPIPEEDLEQDILNMLNMLKPTIAGMLGPLGEQMHFFAYNNKDKDGDDLVNILKKGSLTIKIGEESFLYRFPLSSMVKKKECPVDNEVLNGNWEYCPWHGEILKYK